MRPVSYLSCTLLLGIVFAGETPKIDTDRKASEHAARSAETMDETAATIVRSAETNGTQVPSSPQDSASQKPAAPKTNGQDSTPQDGLATQASAVEKRVVPLADEPHHQIVLRNDYVHVYSVSVQPLDATLIHRHDLPYLAVSLGATDVENDVAGKPAVRLSLQDSQVIYSTGGFAHAVRTDAGMVFHNVTIELAKPQGAARNLCKQIVAGPLACAEEAAKGKKPPAEAGDDDVPYFETDEVRVDVIKVSGGHDYVAEAPKENALLVALTNANLDVNLAEYSSFLHEGDVVWLPAGIHRKVVDFLGTHSSFLLVSLMDSAGKESAGGAKP